jgi:hypothetical protein
MLYSINQAQNVAAGSVQRLVCVSKVNTGRSEDTVQMI